MVFNVVQKRLGNLNGIIGTTIYGVFFVLAWVVIVWQNSNNNKDFFHKNTYQYLVAVVDEPPDVREKSVKILLKIITGIDSNRQQHNASGSLMSYFAVDSASENIRYGDKILVKNYAKTIEKTMLGDFDYQRFLNRKGIYQTMYVAKKSWQLLERNRGNPVKSFALDLRDKMLNILRESGLSGQEYAISSAILLGYGKELDNDLRTTYQATGTMHILCVSGMHLGLFAVVLSRLLFFLRRKKLLIILKTVIMLLLIWGYSLLTGLAPSVLRAAVMFSFTTIGQLLNRSTNIINSLAVSALLLLVIDPMMLYDIGFQLSYLAVLGIVLLQNMFGRFWQPKYKMLKYFWEMTTVSLAAQIITAPLCIHYFGIFPNYFLLSNYVAGPVSTVLIPLGMFAFIVCATIPQMAFVAIFSLKWVVKIMNISMQFIENMPFSVMRNLELSMYEVLFIYVGMLSLWYAFKNAKRTWVFVGLSSWICCCGFGMINELIR
ncbi:hypothetical protein FACS1894178_5110 [Bacteroidia bacterium]|nr:hypothetical protein FACS1894178_5110 [Bacteroidia bacterium]